jgi:hypothetical protein
VAATPLSNATGSALVRMRQKVEGRMECCLNVEGCESGNVAMFHRCLESVPAAPSETMVAGGVRKSRSPP